MKRIEKKKEKKEEEEEKRRRLTNSPKWLLSIELTIHYIPIHQEKKSFFIEVKSGHIWNSIVIRITKEYYYQVLRTVIWH